MSEKRDSEMLSALEELRLELQEERRQKEEERRQKEEALRRLGEGVIKEGTILPKLDNRDLKTSEVSVREFSPAKINEEKDLSAFGIEFINCIGKYSQLLGKGGKAPLDWVNEADIQDYVKTLVKDLLKAHNLPLECRQEVQAAHVRPDVWVMYSASGIPVGVIEVKIPVPRSEGEKILELPKIHGQIFDYLKELQAFHGAKDVVGIVTTYNEWRAYVLKDGQMERKMDASEVFSWDSPHIFEFVAGCLVRMAKTRGAEMQSGEKNRTVVKFEEMARSWLTILCLPETDDEIPVEDGITDDTIYVSRMIGHGAFGNVCEAIYQKKGRKKWIRCAVKFTMEKEADLKRECQGWNKAYMSRNDGKDVAFVKTFNNHRVLVMPYVEEFKEEEKNGKKQKYREDVDKCIGLLAEMKIRHDELEWRHVGFRCFKDNIEVWFTDFGRYSEYPETVESGFLVKNMQDRLYGGEER
jgi:hypothetical protein